jgi:hypothetical protein
MTVPTKQEVFSKHPQNKTQKAQIKEHLLEHKTLTTWEAFTEYHITRISEYIRLLREEGLKISTEWTESNGKRFGIYTLKED